jgi:hypothetical protein
VGSPSPDLSHAQADDQVKSLQANNVYLVAVDAATGAGFGTAEIVALPDLLRRRSQLMDQLCRLPEVDGVECAVVPA